MKALLCLALLASVLAIDINSNIWTNQQQKVLAEIKQSNWGSWLLDFAELHLESQGALQQLVEGIQDILSQLEEELQDLNQRFNRRTDEHNRETQRLQQEIEQANRDLFNGNDLIDNVLIPTKQRLENALDQLNNNIAQNRKNLQDETLQRKKENELFQSKAAEHQEALDAVDQSLQLIGQLQNPSLVQIKKIQGNLAKLEKQLQHHDTFSPLVRALVELATEENFANQGAIQELVVAFNSLRVELVNSLNQETADEAVSAKNFEERVKQLNSEHAEFQRQVLFRTAELNRTNEKLQQTHEYVDQRAADLATLTAQLQSENDLYAQESDIYNNLVAQYRRELDAAGQAYALVTQPSFTDYVKRKLGL